MSKIVFTVKNSSSVVVSGASIVVGNVTQTTDTNGQAIIDGLVDATEYSYTVSSSVYADSTGSVTTSSDSISVAVKMLTDKEAYKALVSELNSLINTATDAMKTDATETVQAASATLVSKAKTQLTASIAYYVDQRSKLKKISQWKEYIEYTSMIGGLYFLRLTITSFAGKVVEWIKNKIESV